MLPAASDTLALLEHLIPWTQPGTAPRDHLCFFPGVCPVSPRPRLQGRGLHFHCFSHVSFSAPPATTAPLWVLRQRRAVRAMASPQVKPAHQGKQPGARSPSLRLSGPPGQMRQQRHSQVSVSGRLYFLRTINNCI